MDISKIVLNNLRSQASLYKLPDPSERQASAIELANLFINLVKMNNIETLFEIGAFNADVSNFLSDSVKNIHAFEASKRNYESAKNNIKNNVVYNNLAVSDRNDYVYVNSLVDTENPGADSIMERSVLEGDYESIKVKSVTIDSYADENDLTNTSIAMWIDVEGAAGLVLDGAKKILAKTQVILIEVEQHEFWKDQCLCGEINKILFENGFVSIARDFEYEHQYNIVYVKNDMLDKKSVDIPLSMFYTRYSSKAY